MTDWATVSSLATAGGTLVLAVATFASVRSTNRSARLNEASLLASLRPLLLPSRLEDAEQKVGFHDGHWVKIAGGSGSAQIDGDGIFLTMSLRNAGNGIAILHGWRVELSPQQRGGDKPDHETFRTLTRDLYIAPGDIGFWQGAIRDRNDEQWDELAAWVKDGERIVIDVLYGDHHGGQRVISRFSMVRRQDDGWFISVARHWNVDRPDPR